MAATQTQIDIVLNAINRVNNVVDRVSRQVDGLARADRKATQAGRVLATTHRSIDNAMKRSLGIVKRLSSAVGVLTAAWLGIRGVKASFAPSIEIEQFEAELAVLLGGFDQARSRIAELQEFAAKTPFEISGIVRASRVLETLTRGALSTSESLRMVGDVAAATGEPIDLIAMHIGRLYDGLMNGRPVGESALRLQELGIISGETRNRIEALQEEGRKGPEVWDELAGSFERFSGLMDIKSRTLGGQLSNFNDNLYNLRAALIAPIRDVITPILTRINERIDSLLDSGKLKSFGENVAAFLKLLFDSFENGTTVELIQLTFEAGAEKFTNDFDKIFQPALDWLDGALAHTMIKGGIKLGESILEGWAHITRMLEAFIVALADKLVDELENVPAKISPEFAAFMNMIKDELGGIITAMGRSLAALPVPGFGVFANFDARPFFKDIKFTINETEAASFQDHFWRAVQKTESTYDELHEVIQDVVNTTESLMGVAGEYNEELTKSHEKWKHLMVVVNEARKGNQALADAAKNMGNAGPVSPNPNAGESNKKEGEEVEIKNRFEQLGTDLQVIAQDMSALMAAPFEGMFYGVSQSIQGLIMQTMTWKNALLNVGQAILGSVVSAIASMAAAWLTSQLMMALGMQTMAATTASSSAAMGATVTAAWLPAAISASIATFGGAAAVGSAAFASAMAYGAGSAVLFGGLASAALGGITAASAASRAFATGGLVTGGEQQIRINEHGEEYVVNHPATKRHLPLLEMINQGATTTDIIGRLVADNFNHSTALDIVNNTATFEPIGRDTLPKVGMGVPPTQMPSGSTNASRGSKLNVAIFDHKQQFKDWLRSTEGRRAFIDIARTNKVELGLT